MTQEPLLLQILVCSQSKPIKGNYSQNADNIYKIA